MKRPADCKRADIAEGVWATLIEDGFWTRGGETESLVGVAFFFEGLPLLSLGSQVDAKWRGQT
eukprot:1253432-Karenia_brevis.AAC.1